MKKRLLTLLLASLFCVSASVARAEDPLLKIQTLPDQSTVKPGMMFLVRAQVINTSSDTSAEFWANTCSYDKHWVTEDPAVRIQPWTCDENTLEQVTLEPGDVYEKNIMLYISKKDKAGAEAFRLGFKRMSENGDVAEPLWGDPVTVQVAVPEAMENSAAVDAVAQPFDAEASAQMTEVPEATEPEPPSDTDIPSDDGEAALPAPPPVSPKSAEPEVDKPVAFQDPGVPIKVGPGDTVSITLASNPSTGFRWKMTLPEGDKTVTFLGSEHVVSGEVMPGVPGTEVFNFKAVTPGETKASFVYERPWETKTAPVRKIFTILVQED